jgi:hypothetical protein
MDELDQAGAAIRDAPIGEPTPLDRLHSRMRKRVRRRQACIALATVCALVVPVAALLEARVDRSVVVQELDHKSAIARRCSAERALSADVDRDSRADRVYLAWNGSSARLGVCTSTGSTGEVACPGQAEGPLLVVSLPMQPSVILCGASSVSSLGFMPYVWRAGTLHEARLPNPNQTEFVSGRGGVAFANVEQFGCPEITVHGRVGWTRRLLAQLTMEPRHSSWTWTRRAYVFTTAGVHLVVTSTGTVNGPLSQHLKDALVPSCPTTPPPGTDRRIDSFAVPIPTRAVDHRIGKT